MLSVAPPERYRVVALIGEGGAGAVYEVLDERTGERLAMKVMPRRRGLANLRGEFLSLARLSHDNIVRVHDYGLTRDGHDYYTMDLVVGPRLTDACPSASSPAFFAIAGGVLQALAFLHARGMVHADIKPSNILVDGDALARDPRRAPKLADFGLAARLSDPRASAARGTFPYAAPEVYAGRLDARSDLYALGVVLYELATGILPWRGDDVPTILAAQRAGPPEDPREASPDIPPGLANLLLALLDPSPGARPQTADEVLERINDIAGTDFATGDHTPLVDLGATLVGRERDVARLGELLDRAESGEGAAVLVSGEEGIGKSRLLAELQLEAQLRGYATYAVSLAAGTGRPYAAVTELVNALLADSGATAEDVPALAPLFADRADAEAADPRARYALAEAIAAVVIDAAKQQPIAILVDDVQEADVGAFELLAYVARAVGSHRAVVAWAVRRTLDSAPMLRAVGQPAAATTAAAGDLIARATALFDRIPHGHRIDLPPLDGHSLRAMVTATFGPEIGRALASDLHRATGGNPAHAASALRSLVSTGVLARRRGAWVIARDISSIPIPPSAISAAVARARALPPDARRTLEVAAVLGERFRADVLAELVGVDDVTDALVDAATARLIGADIGAGWFYFAHRNIGAALYRELPASDRTELHRRAAAALERLAAAGEAIPADVLAPHYVAIGDRQRGAVWSARAGDQREAVRDLHGAVQWYEQARILTDDPTAAAELDERLGNLRALLGDAERACADLQRAHAARTDDPAARVRIARRLGELLSRRGDGEQAVSVLQSALAEARTHRMQRDEALCQYALGRVLMYRSDYAAATEHAVAGHVIARSLGDRATSARIGKLRATIAVYQGDAKRALDDLTAALDDAEAAGDPLVLADVHFGIGRAAIHDGDYTRAIDAYERAIPVFERAGYIGKLARCINNLGAAYYFQGQWAKCRERWEQFRDLCLRLDEQAELVNALNNLGLLYRDLGEFDAALATFDRGAELARQVGYEHIAAMIEGNRGDILFRQADLAGARELYERALSRFRALGAAEDVVEQLRRICEVDVAQGRLAEALDRAIDAIRQAQDVRTRIEEGNLHRVAASALRAQGDYESARWFCARARDILDSLGARFEVAKCDLEAGEIEAAAKRPDEATALLKRAVETFADMGARWHLARARSRLKALSDGGQRTPGAHGRADVLFHVLHMAGRVPLDELLGLVLDKILEVTRFDRGFILLLDRDGRPRERLRRIRGQDVQEFGRDDAAFSGSIVRRVAASGEPIAVTDIADNIDLRDQESIVMLGLRQVMCAPMMSRGRTFGIVYVDSRALPHEARDADLPLLEALAAQASIAIENARLVEEERRKTELMSILAHEIRNPLSGILGFSSPSAVEAMQLDELPGLLEHIHRDAQRLKRLLDNVLELARHERGETDWSMEPFDLAPLLDDVCANFRAGADNRSVRIEVDATSPCMALGNPDRIFQVVTNLVANAVKFSPDGGVIHVRARTEAVRAGDPDAPPAPPSDLSAWGPTADADVVRDYVRVDVSDEGPGMTEEVRARMFEKFAQGDKKRGKGIGLGLYISREIIDRHGGSIWVDSEPGRGSTFSFRIPAATSL
ncbi:MAG: GAF domain-containing protein [Deltaproteobacteria bacterium]|nr:MAG: GAF domain-containing protein [Deltaproteobacteria bacterium]